MSESSAILRVIDLELANLRRYLDERLDQISRSSEIDGLREEMYSRFASLEERVGNAGAEAVAAAETAAAVAIDAAEAAAEAAEDAAEEAEEAAEEAEEETEEPEEDETETPAVEEEPKPNRGEETEPLMPSRQAWFHRPLYSGDV